MFLFGRTGLYIVGANFEAYVSENENGTVEKSRK